MNLTDKEFLEDVASHKLTVLLDDGLYRHIRLSKPGSGDQRFDLLTWPGHLCYTGDMGTFVFQRLDDMFEFFRTDRDYAKSRGRELGINLGYWAQKLIAVDGNRQQAGATEFSEEKFRRVINEYRVDWVRNAARDRWEKEILPKEKRRELWEAVQDDVLDLLDEGDSDSAKRAAHEFVWRDGAWAKDEPQWSFTDLFEHDFTQYTHAFVWCCYALAWGIEVYDAAKAAQETSTLTEQAA